MDERLITILNDIERYFNDIKRLGINKQEDLKNVANYYAASMLLFSLLNRIIDLAQQVVIAKSLGMPVSYKDTFRILFENGLIDKRTFEQLKKFVELRNALSHEYYRIEHKDIFEALQKSGGLRAFVEKMKKM